MKSKTFTRPLRLNRVNITQRAVRLQQALCGVRLRRAIRLRHVGHGSLDDFDLTSTLDEHITRPEELHRGARRRSCQSCRCRHLRLLGSFCFDFCHLCLLQRLAEVAGSCCSRLGAQAILQRANNGLYDCFRAVFSALRSEREAT